MSTLVGCFLRQSLWRAITYLNGGLAVSGPVPRSGPGIVVANHTSHADTAIMFATLPASSKPFAVAAADYWLSTWYKKLAVSTLVDIVPVSRTGESEDPYRDLLAAVRRRTDHGDLVLLYPEGTRTTTGEIGEFKSGAVRLASDLQMPIYPAAILGALDVFPKHGHIRHGTMEVAFGEPFDVPADAGRETVKQRCVDLRGEVVALKRNDVPTTPVSRRWLNAVSFVSSWKLWLLAFVWGIAEAISWPLVAESCLLFLAIVVPRRVVPAAVVLAIGSAVGVVLQALMVFHGLHPPMPLTTHRMLTTATGQFQGGYGALRHQLLSGIPVKVYGYAAGDLARAHHATPAYLSLFGNSLLWRGLRIVAVGALAAGLGHAFRKTIQRHYFVLFWGGFVVFAVALRLIVAAWQ